MAEWLMVPVLKTGVGRLTEGSNPSLSAIYSNSSGVIFYTNGLWSENATPNLIHERCCLFTDMNVKIFILHHGVGSCR